MCFNIKCLDREGDSEEHTKDSYNDFGAKITVKVTFLVMGAGKMAEGSQKT